MIETIRQEAPSSYLMKVVGFSEVKLNHEPYASAAFNASGHKWILIFHPAGKEEEGGKDHVSVYATLENVASCEMLTNNWEIKVELKFFIYNHNVKKYSTFQDGTVKCYNETKKEQGFAKMLPLSKFNDPKNGYINEDTCILGVEIFVIKPVEKLQRVVFTHNPPNNKFTWKVSDFSKLGDEEFYFSHEFVVGDRKWRMKMNPKGSKEKKGLSVFVQARAYLPNAIVASTYASIKLRILNQKNSNHVEKIVRHIFPSEIVSLGHGKDVLIPLKDLHDKSKGYLVNDTIVLETYLLCLTETKAHRLHLKTI